MTQLTIFLSPVIHCAPVYTKSECNEFLYYFVNRVISIRSSISLSSLHYPNDLLSSDTWPSFAPVTLQDISALIDDMKPTSCSLDVLPASLFISVFDSIGPCTADMINTSLNWLSLQIL